MHGACCGAVLPLTETGQSDSTDGSRRAEVVGFEAEVKPSCLQACERIPLPVKRCDSFIENPLPYFFSLFDHIMESMNIDITSCTTKDQKPSDS